MPYYCFISYYIEPLVNILYRGNITVLSLFHNIQVFGHHKTNLNNKYTPSIKSSNIYTTNRTIKNRANKGIAILDRSDYSRCQIPIHSRCKW